jgi:stage III sporulation protein AH
MLITAGYLNYTSGSNIIETSTSIEETKDYASIGDATLVNSKDIITDEDKQEIENIIQEAQTSNDTKETSTNTVEEVEATVDTNTTIKDEDDYFTESKLERDKMYSQMLETYQKILESTNISQEQKAISEQEITKINQTKNAIMIAENLISTKGFENSVIFVNDSSVSVVVKAETLQDEQIAQIQNIISRELNAEVENIHISNK